MTLAALLFLSAPLPIVGVVVIALLAIMLALLALLRPAERLIDVSNRFNDGIDEVPENVSIGKLNPFAPVAETIGLFGDLVHKQSRTFWTERLEKEAVLASLNEGVVICDGEGRVTKLNSTAAKMFGIACEEVELRRLFEVGDKGELVRQCGELLVATLENRIAISDSFITNSGTHFDLTLTPRPKRPGAILVIRDGNNDHKVEQMGRDFIANASHELRTPITIVKGFAETLQDLPEISEAMLEDITDKIIRNCERMSSLVKSLITLADLDALSKSDFQKNNLVVIVEKCRDTLLSIHPDTAFELTTSSDEILVLCDPHLLELAIMNLLENGVKYSDERAQLSVALEEGKLSISDKGKGIPEDDLEHIFDRFYTVDKAHSRRLGGAGLGLSIVKRIMDIHSGKISVTSNGGTTFLLEFE